MSNDYGRTNIVFRLHCGDCKKPVRIDYETSEGPLDKPCDDNITGADKKEMSLAVHPCDNCKAKYMKTHNDFKSLINSLNY